jgi:hypothetical protein
MSYPSGGGVPAAVSASSYTSSAASGANGFILTNDGARVQFGTGANAYCAGTSNADGTISCGTALRLPTNAALYFDGIGGVNYVTYDGADLIIRSSGSIRTSHSGGNFIISSGRDLVLGGGGALYLNGVGASPALAATGTTGVGVGTWQFTLIEGTNNNSDAYGCGAGVNCYINVARYRINSVPFAIATNPSVASGGCTSPAIVTGSGTAAFNITIGTSCAGVSTIVLTFPAANNGWVCNATNATTPLTRKVVKTAGSTTSVTLTNVNQTTAAAADWGAGDTIEVQCSGR